MIPDRTVVENIRSLGGWLVVLNGPIKNGDFRLFSGKTTVGSGHTADIQLQDPRIEPLHFSIRLTGGEIGLTDLDSDSGLFIRDRKIFKEIIDDETIFKAGDVEFLIKTLG